MERQRASAKDEVESTREKEPGPGSFFDPHADLAGSVSFEAVVHWHGICDVSLSKRTGQPMEQLGLVPASNVRSGLFFNGVA